MIYNVLISLILKQKNLWFVDETNSLLISNHAFDQIDWWIGLTFILFYYRSNCLDRGYCLLYNFKRWTHAGCFQFSLLVLVMHCGWIRRDVLWYHIHPSMEMGEKLRKPQDWRTSCKFIIFVHTSSFWKSTTESLNFNLFVVLFCNLYISFHILLFLIGWDTKESSMVEKHKNTKTNSCVLIIFLNILDKPFNGYSCFLNKADNILDIRFKSKSW